MIATSRSFLARCLLLTFVAAIATTAMPSRAVAETFVIQGSTTFNRRLVEPYKSAIENRSKHELTVIPNKSLRGLIALVEGRAQMAMISAPLRSEIEQLKKLMPGSAYNRLQAHPIQSTRIAITVHRSNQVRGASLDQVRKMILGQISNWSELGGNDQPIRVVLVGSGGGVTTVVESELLDGKSAEGSHIIYVKTPVQLVQVVEQEPGIIGFAQLALAQQRGLRELTTERTIQQSLSLVTLGDPSPAMKAVIEAARDVAANAM